MPSKNYLKKHITPLVMNGLEGRVLNLKAPKGKKRPLLLIYGHHSSLERLLGLAEELNKYGAVTMPDLPGFGGMDSFYKIGMKPTLDNLADYLASFIKLHYKKDQKISIFGMSFGFIVATRMLQRNPDLVKRVDLLISIVGFVHHDDFKFKRRNYLLMRYGSAIFSTRFSSWFATKFLLRPSLIRFTYKTLGRSNVKLVGTSLAKRNRLIDFEIGLWRCNDVRTYMSTTITMLTLDLCKERVNCSVYHVSVEPDRYFDNNLVEQHMRVIFKDVHVIPTTLKGHAPTVIADAKDVVPFVPAKLRKLLEASS